MISILDVRAEGLVAPSFEFTLSEVLIRIRMRWMGRIRRWWYVIEDPSGEPLTRGQLVASGGRALWDAQDPRTPRGELRWIGPDPYDRGDLGVGLRLIYDPEAGEAPERRTYRAIVLARTRRGVTFDSEAVTWDSTAYTFDEQEDE